VAHGAGERLTAARGAGRRGAAHLLGDGRRPAGSSASTKQRRRAASSGGVRRAASSSSSKQGWRGLGACRAAARAGQGAAGRPRPSATASTEQDLQLRGQASLAPADDGRRGGAAPPRRRDALARRLRDMAGGLLRAGMRSSSSLLSLCCPFGGTRNRPDETKTDRLLISGNRNLCKPSKPNRSLG